MKQFKHTIITYDHLLSMNVDGCLHKLIKESELAGTPKGTPKDSLISMAQIREHLNFKLAANMHIIFCHPKKDDGSVSCRLVMAPNDILACKFLETISCSPASILFLSLMDLCRSEGLSVALK